MSCLVRRGLFDIKLAAHPLGRIRLAAPWVALAGSSLLAGALGAGQADVWLGTTWALLLLAVLVGGAFLVLFTFIGSSAVVIWPVAATGGFLLQFPRSHPVITFDRLWIGGLLAYIAVNRRGSERSPATRLLFLALLWLVVAFGIRAFTTSASIGGPVATWINALVLPAILLVACERYCLSGPDRVRRLAGALMIAGGILGAIGIAERVWGFELASLTGGTARFDAAVDLTRVSGPYPAPEPYALSLIVCLAATLYWIRSPRKGTNYGWALVAIALQSGAIALVLFRAAWIAAIIVVVASIGLRPGRIGRTFGVVLLVAALALAATSQLEQNKTFATRANDTKNIYGRLATYEQGFHIFRSAPVFGIGVNQYHTVAEARSPETVSGVQSVTWPHNSFLGLLAEQGIVGFLPLLMVSYAVWRLVRNLRIASFSSEEAGLLTGTVAGAALGYLLMSLTLTMLPYEPSNAFFAVLLGAAAGQLEFVLSRTQSSSI